MVHVTNLTPSGSANPSCSELMTKLEVPTVRELEDLLINECMATGLVRGKLDQRRRCFEVHFAIGRDLRPGQLKSLISTIADWCVQVGWLGG
jgi:COP9 signalosome complex subunit 7